MQGPLLLPGPYIGGGTSPPPWCRRTSFPELCSGPLSGPSPPPWGLAQAAAPLLLPGAAASIQFRSPFSSSLGFRLLSPRCPSPRAFFVARVPARATGGQGRVSAGNVTAHTLPSQAQRQTARPSAGDAWAASCFRRKRDRPHPSIPGTTPIRASRSRPRTTPKRDGGRGDVRSTSVRPPPNRPFPFRHPCRRPTPDTEDKDQTDAAGKEL
ncbi:hypothetical protein MAA8898_02914 [Maliponia aquimaris]|uniref:Uncharacterized protein n=1 Tax=Maliponia aquimaris TaxID=1673631 RepID=A0A238KNU3_9RHOB|nr:hypothetical protein MAA8898_02914 [Maliponia aquimaris]